MSKVLDCDKMELLSCHEGNLFLFKPTLFRQFPKSGNMHEMTLQQRIRFFFLYLHGYRVYVLANTENDIQGCVTFANGGTYRYPFAGKNDLICGPYYTMPKYRNQGIAFKLLSYVIRNHEKDFENIYAHVHHENIASVKCLRKVGFSEAGFLSVNKITRKCSRSENGLLILMTYQNHLEKHI